MEIKLAVSLGKGSHTRRWNLFLLLIGAALHHGFAFVLSSRPISDNKLAGNGQRFMASTSETLLDTSANPLQELSISFSHVQMYVDRVDSLEVYKDLENTLNANVPTGRIDGPKEAWCDDSRKLWHHFRGEDTDLPTYTSQNRDIVKQLMVGFGFRVTACRYANQNGGNTDSVLVTSCDPKGVQFVISACSDQHGERSSDEFCHFDRQNLDNFFQSHINRQGIAVLAFEVNNIYVIHESYQHKHEGLIHSFSEYTGPTGLQTKILEVYAYYLEDDGGVFPTKRADIGTILRFVEVVGDREGSPILPGLQQVGAVFPSNSKAAYCDHWVSNVFSRTDFLATLEDTLGFSTKVDFNAGVVAAGEAQIESTVIGNDSPFETSDTEEVLGDQSQVYLPINNAISSVGHVSKFLQEYGQGIQHIASRVENLVDFVENCNNLREITGEGFTFLNIPRSYYGILTAKYLAMEANIESDMAAKLVEACEARNILSADGSVALGLSHDSLTELLATDDTFRQLPSKKDEVIDAILKSRYRNLASVLGDKISDETYLGIVRNQVLVDVQGEDILFQIFTCNILQRDEKEEAPFLEFIQRVCAAANNKDSESGKLKAGCGGFGIRNFLALFLSIEMNKAMCSINEAKAVGDTERQVFAERQLTCLTDQMNDSNPILTEISDSMAEEGFFQKLLAKSDASSIDWEAKLNEAGARKQDANERLIKCSAKYNLMMKTIREESELLERTR